MKNSFKYISIIGLLLNSINSIAADLPQLEKLNTQTFGAVMVSPSGNWVAVLDQERKLNFLQTKQADELDFSPSFAKEIYWVRWANNANDKLIVSAYRDGKNLLLSIDPSTKKIEEMNAKDDVMFSEYASYANNYKFSLTRFANKEKNEIYDLTPEGNLQLVEDKYNFIPTNLKNGNSFMSFSYNIKDDSYNWAFGIDKRQVLSVSPLDQERGTKFLSVSKNNKAFFISSVDRNVLGLDEYDLETGARKTLAQESVDLQKVILNPDTFEPDAVVFEDRTSKIKVLNSKIATDIAYLSSFDNGKPQIKDRAPQDNYWVVSYPSSNSQSKWFIYDRPNKNLSEFSPSGK